MIKYPDKSFCIFFLSHRVRQPWKKQVSDFLFLYQYVIALQICHEQFFYFITHIAVISKKYMTVMNYFFFQYSII
ncbi:Uncharacterized protein dnm_051600 [Desulfonema magnum]|uniref:Uncharacterized protein n=1 Tax=Desulfonema magnum TaxID=45655 RepID=A0A975GPR0_9BACT|nr:Uncharacterized protein dnm_051600 [Desulfonema magnum]